MMTTIATRPSLFDLSLYTGTRRFLFDPLAYRRPVIRAIQAAEWFQSPLELYDDTVLWLYTLLEQMLYGDALRCGDWCVEYLS